jgi:antitoxin Phd
MKTVQLRDAKATLSALVDAAEGGETTLITRHGRPAAMLVPVDLGQRLNAPERATLADFLLSIPVEFEAERDTSPLRPVDL